MSALIPLIINFIVSLMILFVIIKLYVAYRRKYLLWFIIILFLIPLLFLYSAAEMSYLSKNSEYFILAYPIIIILAEFATIMAQRNLIFSLKTEHNTSYKHLLRKDLALIQAFGQLSNYLIERISLFVGSKQVEQIIDEYDA